MTVSPQTLQQHLDTELALVQRFIDILHAEAGALEQADHGEALDATTRKKNTCIAQLTKAGHARENALLALGYSADRAGLEAAVSAHPELAASCENLFKLGQQASELNASNGVIIDTYLKHTQQALQTMQHMVSSSNLYDASGRSDPVKGRRTKITAG